jgi:hypothetical protein
VYVVVLGATLVVGITALAAMSLARVELRDAAMTEDLRNARRAAASGIEYALHALNNDPDWRTTLGCCEEQPPVYLGASRFTWKVSDYEDDDLGDDPLDHATITVTGYGTTAVAVVSLQVEPSGETGVSCLGAAVFADTGITLLNGANLEGSGFVHTNVNAALTTAECDLDIDAVGVASGGAYNAGKYEGIDPLQAPGDHALDWYIERGTRVSFASIPSVLGTRTILGRLLSPQHNPFGETNPWGIYVIDCAGQNLSIAGSRVYGTLVILNPGSASGITDVVHMQPVAPNYPSLMVQGSFRFDMDQLLTNSRTLRETSTANFNPVGAPYLGLTDSDTSDTYPSRVEGLVYVTGQAQITDTSEFVGTLIAGRVSVDANQTLTITHQRYALDYPPPGFSAGPALRALPGGLLKTSR